MTKAEQIRQWLEGALPDFTWLVDSLGARSGSGGVFPRGSRQLRVSRDILGNLHTRQADTYHIKLRLAAAGNTDAASGAAALEALSNAPGAPVFGADPRTAVEDARLASADGSTAVWQATLILEYEVTQ